MPKVFVVDSDPAVLSSVEAVLSAQSYDVECFLSAEEFLAQQRSTNVDCVVVDLSTTAMSGSDLMRHFEESRSLLSVVVAGLIDSTAAPQKEKGPVSILAKQYELWALLSLIKDAIMGGPKRDRALVHIVSGQADWMHHYGTNVPSRDKVLKLSPRQRQVLLYLLAGGFGEGSRSKAGN